MRRIFHIIGVVFTVAIVIVVIIVVAYQLAYGTMILPWVIVSGV